MERLYFTVPRLSIHGEKDCLPTSNTLSLPPTGASLADPLVEAGEAGRAKKGCGGAAPERQSGWRGGVGRLKKADGWEGRTLINDLSGDMAKCVANNPQLRIWAAVFSKVAEIAWFANAMGCSESSP